MKTRLAGSFAPPLSDTLLSSYSSTIADLPASPLKDGLTTLLTCCSKWWELPESTAGGTPHPIGMGIVVDLDEPIATSLEPHIPWNEEIAMIQGLCDSIAQDGEPANVRLRDCAFHLLWHVKELALDREPLTNDKL